MDFHLAFTPKPFAKKMKHTDKILLIGSCFTENIGGKLRQFKFDVLENPNGILFNPVSICQSLVSYIENKRYTVDELFYANESWNSWQHHSRFSHPDKETCLNLINQSQQQANTFLQTADWILITLGSAFVYSASPLAPLHKMERGSRGEVVANCHKMPADNFNRRLLSAEEVLSALDHIIHRLKIFNPSANIIFTISPVRHLREGFIENNRSKAVLIQAVHHLVDKFDQLFYFPAYELVIDDLRDYRFYAEDMVHPNYAATNYVWEKFVDCSIDNKTKELMQEINVINAAMNHRPFNPASQQHKKFLGDHLQKVQSLQQRFSYINFEEELNYFSI